MENFVVSARKYRPATFASVVGQRHITSTLKNAVERGQLAHAYLFCGPRGVGKTTCARIFAKTINCQNPQGGEACNECESCRSFNEGRSLNVHELDAASNNSVDDIRNLIEQVRIIPQQGSYSVFVIDEVHMLSAAAFNAFLKTLEEPPRHAIFILATTEKHKIIPTILSRCQIYDFNRIRVEDGVEYLRYIASQEGVDADDEALNLISHKADGGMRDALSMFDKAVSFCGNKLNYKDVAATLNVLDYDTYFSITDMLREGRYVDALIAFDGVLAKGFSPQIFISGLNAHMRDLLMSKGPAISLVEFTGSLVERYKAQAALCDEAFLFGAISLLTEADGRIRQSSNQRLLVELGLMKIAGLGPKKNSDTVTLTYATEVALPELAPAVAVPQPQPQPRQTSAPVAAATPMQQTVESQPEQRVVPPSAPAPQPMPKADETDGENIANSVATSTAADKGVMQRRATTIKPAVSRISLSAMMDADAASSNDAGNAELQDRQPVVDPDCEAKINAVKDSFVQQVMAGNRRYGVVFDTMRVKGNVVTVDVVSAELKTELLRDTQEWTNKIAKASGVVGPILLEVELHEKVKTARPITIEDRLRYMTERNENLTDMIERLVLDAE
ncbi:MAG: DNA polymerase III subunit gamma/tau [Alistipes sp.]|nr:DNA polymerase III subunit gamma/tau [Alistipes sp.]